MRLAPEHNGGSFQPIPRLFHTHFVERPSVTSVTKWNHCPANKLPVSNQEGDRVSCVITRARKQMILDTSITS
jgi:hypothetical protein